MRGGGANDPIDYKLLSEPLFLLALQAHKGSVQLLHLQAAA